MIQGCQAKVMVRNVECALFSGTHLATHVYGRFLFFLPYSFICNIFLCHLILSNLLCLWSPFCRLQGHSSSCFWSLPPRGEIGPGACVGFLVGGTGACALVGGAWSCLSGGQGHVKG